MQTLNQIIQEYNSVNDIEQKTLLSNLLNKTEIAIRESVAYSITKTRSAIENVSVTFIIRTW